MLYGAGTLENIIRIWDMKTGKNVVSFEGHQAEIVDLSFSENGFYLASVANDQTVKLWDLRKCVCFETMSLLNDFQASSIEFDFSGSYLAVAGKEIRSNMNE